MVKIVPEESAGINPHVVEGIYIARLAGIVEKVLEVPKEGSNEKDLVPRWEWVLGIRAPEKDERFTVLTSPKMTTKSKAFGFTKAMRGGKNVELGVEFDTDSMIGNYVNVTVKDKQRKDRTGNIQVTSEITDMMPLLTVPTKEINIEGLIVEEEDEAPPVPAPAVKKTGRK
jgi:hypothetical protein